MKRKGWHIKRRCDRKRLKRVNEDFYKALMRTRDRGPRNGPHRRWRAILRLPVDITFRFYGPMKSEHPGWNGRVTL